MVKWKQIFHNQLRWRTKVTFKKKERKAMFTYVLYNIGLSSQNCRWSLHVRHRWSVQTCHRGGDKGQSSLRHSNVHRIKIGRSTSAPCFQPLVNPETTPPPLWGASVLSFGWWDAQGYLPKKQNKNTINNELRGKQNGKQTSLDDIQ